LRTQNHKLFQLILRKLYLNRTVEIKLVHLNLTELLLNKKNLPGIKIDSPTIISATT